MKKFKVQINSKVYSVEVENEFTSIDGKRCNEESSLKQHRTFVKRIDTNHYDVWIKNYKISVDIQDEKSVLLAKFQKQSSHHHELNIKAPMPGLVVAVEVQVGDEVVPGSGLIVLEAMKMENEIKSPAKAKITTIEVKKGDKVEKGQVLMVLEEDW